MTKFRQVGLAGVAAFVLMASQGHAQTPAETPQTESGGAAEPVGAPTPTEPAATETPAAPAASGGEASDATRSGAPAGAAPATEQSGGADAAEPDAAAPDAADADAAEQPSNEVGEIFELPRIGDKGTQIELIAGLCGIQMNDMSAEACTCLANQAYEQLTPPQRDYLIAAVVAPPVAERMIGDGRVALPDQQTIFAFLTNTANACTTGTYTPAAAGTAPAGAPPASTGAPAGPTTVPPAPATLPPGPPPIPAPTGDTPPAPPAGGTPPAAPEPAAPVAPPAAPETAPTTRGTAN